MFSTKCQHVIKAGVFEGQRDATWLDVYVACLEEPIPVEQLKLDTKDKSAVRYISMEALQQAYLSKNPEFVIPQNEEYTHKLFQFLGALTDPNRHWGRPWESNGGRCLAREV